MKELITTDGRKIYRMSRWIQIQHNYTPSKRNRLWHYVTDGSGYNESSPHFDPVNGLYLDYFKYNGRTWAIDQFMRLDYPIMYEENSKLYYLSGYDAENYYSPILIELDEYCEHVRVYEEG